MNRALALCLLPAVIAGCVVTVNTPGAPGTTSPSPSASTSPAAASPSPSASPATLDVAQAILGVWTYNDLQYSSKLTFNPNGDLKTEVGKDATIPMYVPGRYTVSGEGVVTLSIKDVPGFPEAGTKVTFNADRSQMTTADGKVYRRST